MSSEKQKEKMANQKNVEDIIQNLEANHKTQKFESERKYEELKKKYEE